jgi:phage tail-like protein
MSRSRLQDRLHNYAFWLVDVSPTLDPPFYALLPVFGFSTITAPEVTLNMREIVQANRLLPVQVVESAALTPLTLTRGASLFESDFWRWIRQVMHGHSNTEKDFLLIQFIGGGAREMSTGAAGAAAAGLLMAGLAGSAGVGTAGIATITAALGTVAVVGGIPNEGWEPRIPAKGWILRSCKPTRYKVAGDFDASSSDVSLQELDLVMEDFEEVALL